MHANSNHPPLWIQNVPFGQFCRLKCICTLKQDYIEQGIILKRKFRDKGYQDRHIEEAYNKYLLLYEGSISTSNSTSYSNNKVRNWEDGPTSTSKKLIYTRNRAQQANFCTRFNNKAWQIQWIFSKNWNPVIGDLILDKPPAKYRTIKKTPTAYPTNGLPCLIKKELQIRCQKLWHL